MVANHRGNIYSRFTNPTIELLEQKFADLSNSQHCIATASGMSAITALFTSLLSKGDHIICANEIFGSTINLLNNFYKKFGIDIDFVNCCNIDNIKQTITAKTKLIFVESPSNPLGRIADISAIAAIAKQNNSLLIVDNTYCTPLLQKPLELGADYSIDSATKYIDGNGRVLAGLICCNGDKDKLLRTYMRNSGPTLSAFNAWLLVASLDTLELRLEKHCANAIKLAEWLATQTWVNKVHYAGLKANRQHNLASKQQNGFGGVLAFEVQGSYRQAWQLIDNCQHLTITPNLGDVKPTIIHPYTTTHGKLSAQQKAEAGIKDNLIRVSVGISAIDLVIQDLTQAKVSIYAAT